MDAAHRLTAALAAALADRYQIESEIDSGGMATVFRARDLKHERTVAIKVLRPELAEAIGADRFLREIRTTANLNHPHILPLHDSGDADGFIYYVMPFVEGQSLKDRMDREGELPIEDAVQIAREVADALAYAHKKGVIHRDIKPANIMLDEGHAFLADFGIALAKAGVGETKLTGSGMSLGTPSYMSPEQVSGDRELDGRADQYALGCVLFEMLAGHPPFTGADIQAVMRQHLVVDTPSVTQARTSVPREVAKAVQRALAKSPADRFRTTAELETALAGATLPLLARIPMGRARGVIFAAAFVLVLALAAVAVSWFPRLGDDSLELVPGRVMVLPFDNLTGDPALDNLATRVAQDVSVAIHQVAQVDPISVNATRPLAGQATREGTGEVLRAVAERTGAALAITGNIFSAGDSLVFSLEIIDVASNSTLQPVEEAGPLEDVGAAIDRLGNRAAGALLFELDPELDFGTQSFPVAPLLEAVRMELAALAADNDSKRAEALEYHLAAYDIDSTFVWAVVEAAHVAQRQGDRATADSLGRYSDQRRSLLPERGQLKVAALFAQLNGDWKEILRVRRRLHELDPRGVPPIAHAGAALAMNYPLEAIAALQDHDPNREWARRVEWLNSYYWIDLCRAYHMLYEHEQELVVAQQGREHYPESSGMLILEIQARAALNQVDEVNSLLDQALALSDSFPNQAVYAAGQELWAHGHEEAAIGVWERGIEWLLAGPPEDVNQGTLAWMLYHAERWEESHAIYQELAPERPGNATILAMLGLSAVRVGDTVRGAEISEQLANMSWPEHQYTHLEFGARLSAVLGRPQEAMRLFRESIARGNPFSLWHHRTMDLESLHQRADWQELMRPKG